MIRPQHPVKADIAIGAHGGQHVGLAGVVPGLLELSVVPFTSRKCTKEIFALNLRMAPGRSLGHQREIALAKGDGVHRARTQLEQPLKIFDRAHDTADAADRRQRRIVRVHREFDLGPLGDRQHSLQEISEILPERLLADWRLAGQFFRHLDMLKLVTTEPPRDGVARLVRTQLKSVIHP